MTGSDGVLGKADRRSNPANAGLRHAILSFAALIAMVAIAATAEETGVLLEPNWEFVADTVMGGVSQGVLSVETEGGQNFVRLKGTVSLENNGGFVQMAMDLRTDRQLYDASMFTGIELTVRGNGEVYDLRLRTDALTRPWQSFRVEFRATEDWTTLRIPFSQFEPHRTEASLDPARLRRVGVLAIGRPFRADISVLSVGFYR